MLSCGLRDLRRRRKMNVAVLEIDRAATEHALPFGLAPGRSGTDFIDHGHASGALVVVRMAWVFPGTVWFWQIMRIDRIGGTGTLQGLHSRPARSCTGR